MFETVKGYKIFKSNRLGGGSYSEVYMARDMATGEEVACKITRLIDQEDLKYAHQEITILESLKNCEHVLALKDYEIRQDEKKVYAFMERMDETLHDLLVARGSLPEGEALYYFYQLLKGVRELHNKKVMHRDLKPDNLFLSGSTLYIGDFNLSIQEDLATSNVGTAMYKCPLIVTEKGPFAHYVDLFSCGLILYKMIYGVHLYDHIGTHQTHQSSNHFVKDFGTKLQDQGVLFPSKPQVTQGTKDLIRRMLDVENIKDLGADQLLRSEVFSRYFDAEEREKNKKSAQNDSSTSNLANSLFNMMNSQTMHVSEFPKGTELTSKLAKYYQKIIINQKAKTLYVQRVVDHAYDYCDFFDVLKRNFPGEYKEKFEEHHRAHFFFLLMLRHYHYLLIRQLYQGMEDLAKFNQFRKQSGLITTEVTQEQWAKILLETHDFRYSLRSELETMLQQLLKELQKTTDYAKESYPGLLSDEKMAWLVDAINETEDLDSAAARFILNFEKLMGSYFSIIVSNIDKKKISPKAVVSAKKIVVLLHYFEKYRNHEKIDWHKFFVSKDNLEMDKETEVLALHASLHAKKQQEDQLTKYQLWVGGVIVLAILLGLFFRFK